ncbi:LacI family DNA-binding transcriptional regulator [Jonesiaceae bacterium BS-20]|uniref:LacI family DNA-binding transcriptional regulator n=1 Tax=Jonesiaceae bacterium BS-20 TaxID=3120821 RepID=A0AAU7DRT6_9MICO
MKQFGTSRVPRKEQASIADVARLAEVSLGTVSNALNRPQIVSAKTLVRVQKAIEDLGYSRNSNASALARGHSQTVGLVLISLDNSMFIDIARGAQRTARKAGMYLQLAAADDDPELLDAHMNVLNEERAAGLMIAPLHDHELSIERSRRAGCPVVEINYNAPDRESCRVLIDNEQAGYVAAKHLISLGRLHLCLVLSRQDYQPIIDRRTGVRRAVAESSGNVTLTELWTDGLDPEFGVLAAQELCGRPASLRPDAVLAVTDMLAMAIINELSLQGLSVPEDIAVMGCDHNSSAWGGFIALSSVTMNGVDLGEKAISLLLAELQEDPSEHVHQTIMLEPEIVPRESTIGRNRTD